MTPMTQEAPIEVTRLIDARGMPCPGPLMSLIGAIREGQVGDVIEVRSSDEGSRTDIPAWVAKARHELLEVVPEAGFARFIVRKAR
jgi:tRNA 2-thiouridine synthesizing protein A